MVLPVRPATCTCDMGCASSLRPHRHPPGLTFLKLGSPGPGTVGWGRRLRLRPLSPIDTASACVPRFQLDESSGRAGRERVLDGPESSSLPMTVTVTEESAYGEKCRIT